MTSYGSENSNVLSGIHTKSFIVVCCKLYGSLVAMLLTCRDSYYSDRSLIILLSNLR